MLTGNESITPIVKPGFTYGDGSYEESTVKEGLTIRQHFAAMAMQGMASMSMPLSKIASEAVSLADVLIEELNKPKP